VTTARGRRAGLAHRRPPTHAAGRALRFGGTAATATARTPEWASAASRAASASRTRAAIWPE
jgi:hypothetical protein